MYSTLSIDLETYSSVDLKKCGHYKYVASDDFEILLFCFAFDDQPVSYIDLTVDELPEELVEAIEDPRIIKRAYNAAFELECLGKHLGRPQDPRQWRCTMVAAGMLGLPMNLADVSRVLMLTNGKLGSGMQLIRKFCIPSKITKTNLVSVRTYPKDAPVEWKQFIEYGMQDVRAEREVLSKISWYKIPEREQLFWELDQKINRMGVAVDKKLLESAIKINGEYQARLMEEAVAITGIANAKSPKQVKLWLEKATKEADEEETFDADDSLKAADLPALIKKFNDTTIKRLLEIRQETSKTSISKYERMLSAMGTDGRIRGTTQYYGANRTGRHAGRIIQPQNYPRNSMKELDLARRAVKTGKTDAVYMLFDSVPDTLKQLLRTAFIPGSPNSELVPCDFASIEARVLAWLAGEEWVLDVFRGDGKIYEATAAAMFKVPIESIGKKSEERQKGKICALALGYGGAVGALTTMGAIRMGIPEKELPILVNKYRQANPNIVDYWGMLRDSAFTAYNTGERVPLTKGMYMQHKRNCLFITLPSGRDLVYCRFGYTDGMGLTYWGVNQTKKKWELTKTYGGKLSENITQAVARDILREGMLNLDAHGFKIPLHIHDEVIIEQLKGYATAERIAQLMCPQISWAEGLPISAEGFVTQYYRKED